MINENDIQIVFKGKIIENLEPVYFQIRFEENKTWYSVEGMVQAKTKPKKYLRTKLKGFSDTRKR